LKSYADNTETKMTEFVAKSLITPSGGHSFLDGSRRTTVTMGGLRIGRGEYRPGWRWSQHAGPLGGRPSAAHLGCIVSGRMTVRAPDGRQVDLGPGDAFQVASGHDAWVLGEEPCVALDFAGAVPSSSAGDAATADTVRWLRLSYRAGAVVDLVAAIGMAIPL
jgi:hypothetical protein